MKGHKFKKQNCSEKGANVPEVSNTHFGCAHVRKKDVLRPEVVYSLS